MLDVSHFQGKEVVVTEKMDGENTTFYSNGKCHARSLSGAGHPSRDWVRRIAGDVAHLLNTNQRVCGENLYAKHSIHYKKLSSLFQVFSVWEGSFCLSWDDTEDFVQNVLSLETVPVLYRGPWNGKLITQFRDKVPVDEEDTDLREGYVVRLASDFHYHDFDKSVAKYVRKNHVQTDEHWLKQPLVRNECRK